jgi:SET and MYND domain-containing protein
MPLATRRETLQQYNFECACDRCKRHLSVYQVEYSALPEWSVVKRSNHAALTDSALQEIAKKSAELPHLPEPLPARHAALKAQYASAKHLVGADLWAVSPVPQLLTETSIYYAQRADFSRALALAALLATACDPFRYPAPFHPVRVKNLFMVAKLLANTAEITMLSSPVAGAAVDSKLREALLDIDQVSLCHMLLILIVNMCPGELAPWELCVSAREMLDDVQQLPGREQDLSLINMWAADAKADGSGVFFEYAVVKQLDVLAALGREVVGVFSTSG